MIHSHPYLPGGLDTLVSSVEAVPEKNLILLLGNWTLPPRKQGGFEVLILEYVLKMGKCFPGT